MKNEMENNVKGTIRDIERVVISFVGCVFDV